MAQVQWAKQKSRGKAREEFPDSHRGHQASGPYVGKMETKKTWKRNPSKEPDAKTCETNDRDEPERGEGLVTEGTSKTQRVLPSAVREEQQKKLECP